MSNLNQLKDHVEKNPTMGKVIVIGCSLTGYAVIRALADKNVNIIAVTHAKKDVAHLSKYVSEIVHAPSPKNEDQFIECLLENAHRWEGALILESSDSAAIALSKNKQLLSKYYRIATPDWEVLSIFVEKEKTYALAKEYDIPHPKTIPLYGMEDLEGLSDILYPCILKPVSSFEFTSRFHTKNFEVSNEYELRKKYELCLNAGVVMILQEIIPGPDDNIYKLQGYVNSQGQMVGKFFYRKLRQNPPQYGIARVGISTDRYPEVERLTEELLTRANYRGYFSNEFKQDPRDGELKLIENNCRMPRSGMLAIGSGINFPWLIFQDLVLNQQYDVNHYQVGTYWIDLWSDIRNIVFRHHLEEVSLGEYIAPYFSKHKVFADLNFQDLKPFIGITAQNIKGFWKRYLKEDD